MNEKPLNLEKMTYIVISVLLIDLWFKYSTRKSRFPCFLLQPVYYKWLKIIKATNVKLDIILSFVEERN